MVALSGRDQYGTRIFVLAGASLFFYGWWDWRYLWVIVVSTLVNFLLGRLLFENAQHRTKSMAILITGITLNLGFLGYFNYTNFLLDTINDLSGTDLPLLHILLPIGISFFTFQQIAYLVDLSKGDATKISFSRYLLFVTFFPQLIAGPIVHHREIVPQLCDGRAGRLNAANLAQGLTIFVIGVGKKVLIADRVAEWSTPVFDAAAAGSPIPFLEAWGAALSYTFQIYFDFSAYSDMAVGLGLMLGLRLPINFASPYKARSLIDFWRRWHITLSRFLKEYLYIPLGGNRAGQINRYTNIMIVMLLGGLWHGASWTFVLWGGLHGLGLMVNHLWRRVRSRAMHIEPDTTSGRIGAFAGLVLTFLFVVCTWVPFRADSLPDSLNILSGMAGLNGVVLPANYAGRLGEIAEVARVAGVTFLDTNLFFGVTQLIVLAILLIAVWTLPNTLEFTGYNPDWQPEQEKKSAEVGPARQILRWRPVKSWAIIVSCLGIASLYFMNRSGEFLYYRF